MSEEEIEVAREMTAIEYLRRYQPNRLKKSSARNEWELVDHDSFKINGISSKWHWKSRDIGGISALNFLCHVEGMSFPEAVQVLCQEHPTYQPPVFVEKEKKPFRLPEKHTDCRRVKAYLKRRGIREDVIEYCVAQGILYESSPYHNAVFVGQDETQKARYAFLRGIYDKSGSSFRIEQEGSDKTYGFCIPPLKESVRVTIYEASIDAMAHLSIEGGNNEKYRLSLGGISAPKEGEARREMKRCTALEAFLKRHPQIEEIEVCTDNDFAGRWACEQIIKTYGGTYRMVKNLPRWEGADYGDMAKAALKEKQINARSERGR